MKLIGICSDLQNCGYKTTLSEDERPICPQCYGYLLTYNPDHEIELNTEAITDDFYYSDGVEPSSIPPPDGEGLRDNGPEGSGLP